MAQASMIEIESQFNFKNETHSQLSAQTTRRRFGSSREKTELVKDRASCAGVEGRKDQEAPKFRIRNSAFDQRVYSPRPVERIVPSSFATTKSRRRPSARCRVNSDARW